LTKPQTRLGKPKTFYDEGQDMVKVTEKNTKRDILTAYNAALAEVKKLKGQKVGRSAEVTDTKNAAVVQRATSASVKDIVQNLADLRVGTNETISNLEESILEKKAQLDDIQKAIQIEKTELKTLHDVTGEADTLAALLEAQAEETRKFNALMTEARTAWDKEKSERAALLTEARVQETKDQKRRTDDFEYQFKLKQQRTADDHAEQVRLNNREITLKREEAEAEFTQRDAELTAREAEFNGYRDQVAAFPAELEKAKEAAVAAALKSEKSSRHFEVSALKRDVDTQKTISDNAIAMLQQKVDTLTEENKHLHAQLDTANAKVQSIASDAIKGAQAQIVQPMVAAGGSK
jgi:hypothetical protein